MSCDFTLFTYIFCMGSVICGIVVMVWSGIFVSQVCGFDFSGDTSIANASPYIYLICGAGLIIGGLLAIFGAKERNELFLILGIIFLETLGFFLVLIFLFIMRGYKGSLQADINGTVKTIWEEREKEPEMLDKMQLNFGCCGLNSISDYGSDNITLSCCDSDATSCNQTNAIRHSGCLGVVETFWRTNFLIMIYGFLLIATIKCLSTLFAFYLCKEITGVYGPTQ